MAASVTIARFHIHVDPACFGDFSKNNYKKGNSSTNDIDNNEYVIMCGSLPSLGGGNIDNSLILTRSADNPYIWSTDPVELPFRRGTSVSAPNELFQLRFGIAKVIGHKDPQPSVFSIPTGNSGSNANSANNSGGEAAGNVVDTRRIEKIEFVEKGIPRDEKASRRNYFYSIQPDYLDSRFDGYFRRNEYYSYFTDFTLLLLGQVRSNSMSPSDFLEVYNDIVESASFATRGRAEDVVDAAMTTFPDNQPIPDDLKMCIMAIIGAFGKSSTDQAVRTGAGSSSGGGYGYNNYYRSIPQPKPWCWKFIADLNILHYFSQPLEGTFGRHYRWCLIGLAEACERISEHFFEVDWLRVIPLLDHHEVRANVSISGEKDDSIKAYGRTSEELLEASNNLLEQAIVEEEKLGAALAEKNAASASSASAPTQELAPKPKPISPARRLAISWLRILIRYAPTTGLLSQVILRIVALDGNFSGCLTDLLKTSLSDRLRTMRINSDKRLSSIFAMIKSLPAHLCGTTIGAAILKNDTIDTIAGSPSLSGFNILLDVITLCTQNIGIDTIFQDESPTQADGKTQLSEAQQVQQQQEADQQFEIESAAKEFLRRNHGSSKSLPEKESDSNNSSNWPWYSAGIGMNAGYGNSYNRRPPTREELAKERLESLESAIDTVNTLVLKTRFFSIKTSGLLFELSRCHFFKGSDELALKALISFYSRKQFAGLHPSLVDFLDETSCRLARSVANDDWAKGANISISTTDRSSSIRNVIDLVLSVTPSSSKFAKDLLYAISLEICSPPYTLASIVATASFWIELVSISQIQREMLNITSSLDKTTNIGEMAFHPLFTSIIQVKIVIEDAKSRLDSGKLRLQELGILLQGSGFITLAERFSSFSNPLANLKNEHILAARKKRDSFRLALDQLLCYVALFCNCGVPIDNRNLRTRTTNISTGYNDLQLGKLDTILGEFESALEAAPWLFSLRNSTLFLEMWRDIGRGLLAREQSHGSSSSTSNNAQQASASTIIVEEPITALPQRLVLREMVPQAKKKWSELKSSIKSGSVPVAILEKTFGRLRSPQMCYNELRILAKTAQADDEKEMEDDNIEQEWLNVASTRTFDFFLLVKLRRAAPALINLREIIGPICTTQISPSTGDASESANSANQTPPSQPSASANHDDDLYSKLVSFNEQLKLKWDTQLFRDVNEILVMIKAEFYSIPASQFEFLTILSESTGLIQWLLNHDSTDEFNRLLQVCRPCILGQDRLLSAMASLVQIRTLLIQLLYVRPKTSKYSGLHAFIDIFVDTTIAEFPEQQQQQQGDLSSGIASNPVEDALWHLRNVVSSFDALHDVFEKQTKSEGIKSCLDLRDIFRSGEFVLIPSPSLNSVLFLEINDGEIGAGSLDVTAPNFRKETEEYLHDLRSKLLMIEIPDEMQDQMGAPPNEMVSSFVAQLEVLCQLRDSLHSLCISGHPKFLARKGNDNKTQNAPSYRFPFRLDGATMMKSAVVDIKNKISQWRSIVKKARDKFHALNAYTMRDIIQISDLMLEYHIGLGKVDTKINENNTTEKSGSSELQTPPLVEEIILTDVSLSIETGVSCIACTLYNQNPSANCSVCGTPLPRRAQASNNASASSAELPTKINKFNRSISTLENEVRTEHADKILVNDLISLLRLCCWYPENIIQDSINEWSAKLSQDIFAKDQILSEEEILLTSVGEFLTSLVHSSQINESNVGRVISAPSSKVQNQSDMLVAFEKSVPLWVTYAKSPLHTIDVALSIYLRRRRLPERGELLYCSDKTTMEDIEIFYRRFLCAKSSRSFSNVPSASSSILLEGKEINQNQSIPPVNDPVYCVVGIENLSYTFQVEMVDKLREMLKEYNTQRASSLVFISGLPNQVSVQLLSDHFTEIPSLPDSELRRAMKEAVDRHVGHTVSVFSHINGAGKSRLIMKHASLIEGRYYRIPIRESTTEATLVAAFLRAANIHSILTDDLNTPAVFHIDIGHVVPYDVNILLFQLCVVGALRDSLSSKVFHRKNNHHIMIEIPNSKGEKTRSALRFSTLLPLECCRVEPGSFELERPQFSDDTCTKIIMQQDEDTALVCTYLDAQERQVFLPGSEEYDINWDLMLQTQIMSTQAERCYEILLGATCNIPIQQHTPRQRVVRNIVRQDDDYDNGDDDYENEENEGDGEDGDENENEDDEEEEDQNSRRNRIIASATAATAAATAAAHADNQQGRGITVPSYQLFSNFVKFLAEQCRQAYTYPLLQQQLLANLPGLEHFKDSFTRLLIETSKDFSLRSVPRPKHMHPTDETIPRFIHENEIIRAEEVKHSGSSSQDKLPPIPAPPVPQLIRERSIDMAVRFSRMVTWESCDHPFVLFYRQSIFTEVEGVDVISLKREFVSQYIGRSLEDALSAQDIDLRKNWAEMTSRQGIEILQRVEGLLSRTQRVIQGPELEPTYVLTVDNMLKMLSILLRLKYRIPCIIMGETGCGKSSLIRELCAIIGIGLRVLNIHGGTTDTEVISWLKEKIAEVKDAGVGNSDFPQVILFLDEINTSNILGLAKELCEGFVDGQPIPRCVQLIFACNPYRLRKKTKVFKLIRRRSKKSKQ